ncbi:MAG TPA: NAD(P)-dependent oxidoreductase [Pirellulales bacterium]|nr:NAD(P)-dependent oxidoreductase [Pirellulales bacterium]
MAVRNKAFLTHRVHASVLERLRADGDVDCNDSDRILRPDEVRSRAGEATAIMVFMTDCIDRDFLQACPRLRIVAGALKGFDNIDVAACTERGVWVTCVADLLTVPTAELAIGLLLSLSRNIVAGDRLMRHEHYAGWRPILYGAPLGGRCLGIYGMGAVGQAIAARMIGFGMRTIYHDPRALPADREASLDVRYVTFGELLTESDYVIVAAPFTADNLHAFDDEALSRMRRGSFLINIGRGSVVDEQAVARALQSGRLAGFAADVYEMEDQSRLTRPSQIEPALIAADHTIFTPHLGSAVAAVREQIELEAAQNILAAWRGQTPPGAVNRPLPMGG